MLFAGREVRIGKNCARGLEYGPCNIKPTYKTCREEKLDKKEIMFLKNIC